MWIIREPKMSQQKFSEFRGKLCVKQYRKIFVYITAQFRPQGEFKKWEKLQNSDNVPKAFGFFEVKLSLYDCLNFSWRENFGGSGQSPKLYDFETRFRLE